MLLELAFHSGSALGRKNPSPHLNASASWRLVESMQQGSVKNFSRLNLSPSTVMHRVKFNLEKSAIADTWPDVARDAKPLIGSTNS